MTVLDGEVYAVLEEGETLLRAGDTMIQRGTRHAWSNRSDHPVTVVTTMLPATRGD
jgi:quercetin dioxygenase-like cupin family protein